MFSLKFLLTKVLLWWLFLIRVDEGTASLGYLCFLVFPSFQSGLDCAWGLKRRSMHVRATYVDSGCCSGLHIVFHVSGALYNGWLEYRSDEDAMVVVWRCGHLNSTCMHQLIPHNAMWTWSVRIGLPLNWHYAIRLLNRFDSGFKVDNLSSVHWLSIHWLPSSPIILHFSYLKTAKKQFGGGGGSGDPQFQLLV